MKRNLAAAVVMTACSLTASQTIVTTGTFQSWLDNGIDFIVFDTRPRTQIDSLVYPCYVTDNIVSSVSLIACKKRMLVIGADAAGASDAALEVIGNSGVAQDSVFAAGYIDILTPHFALADTLPIEMLSNSSAALPQSLAAAQLWAMLPGNRDYRLVDVRRPDETAAGMIPGACMLTWPDPFQSSIGQLGKDQDIIVYNNNPIFSRMPLQRGQGNIYSKQPDNSRNCDFSYRRRLFGNFPRAISSV
jgi:hypothetical protein